MREDIYITISGQRDVTIKVSRSMRIIDTINLLNSKGYQFSIENNYIYNERSQQRINIYMCYKDVQIYNGDKLCLDI